MWSEEKQNNTRWKGMKGNERWMNINNTNTWMGLVVIQRADSRQKVKDGGGKRDEEIYTLVSHVMKMSVGEGG